MGDARQTGTHGYRNTRAHERQHLPLRRVPKDRGGDPPSRAERVIVYPFEYQRPTTIDAALSAVGAGGKFIGGGTNLVDLMKAGIERPQRLIDVNHLRLETIENTPEGGLRIGAGARNSDVAAHADVQHRYPLLSQALLAGASPQLRNMATVGGNLLQRTRC